MNAPLTSGWLPVARLLRPQGRRGELLADPLSDLPGLFAAGREVYLVATNTSAATNTSTQPPGALFTLEDHWFPTGKNAGRIVLKLSGCDSITSAEALAGNDLLVSAANLPALAPDTFFVGDLVGCTLYDSTGPSTPTLVGTVVDLEFATGPDGRTRLEDAAPLLAIAFLGPHEASAAPPDLVLVPFVSAWLDSVDIPAKRITMRLPEGLVDSPSTQS